MEEINFINSIYELNHFNELIAYVIFLLLYKV